MLAIMRERKVEANELYGGMGRITVESKTQSLSVLLKNTAVNKRNS